MKSYVKVMGLLVLGSVLQISNAYADNSQSKELMTLSKLLKDKAIVAKNIETFDELDFKVFTGQQWHRVKESHGENIVVHWPDGRTTTGIDVHIEDMKAMFVWSDNLKITEHPIKFGADNWTAVIGEMTGTFSKPMPIGGGKTIPPTGKTFTITMATIGYWEDGVMTEEYLFWDNKDFMKQIGLGQ